MIQTTSHPTYIDALDALGACTRDRGPLYRYLCGHATLQAAWDGCQTGNDMLWLIARRVWRNGDPWGTPEHRYLVGCLVEIVLSLAQPFWREAERPALEGTMATLERYAAGGCTREEVRAARWSAAGAVVAAADAARWSVAAAAAAAVAAVAAVAADAAARWSAAAAAAADASLAQAAEIVRAHYPIAPEVPHVG